MLLEHLALAKGHIAKGEGHISKQKEIIAQFERNGHDTARAHELLAIFQQSQRQHKADHERILKELNALDAAGW